MLLSIQHPGMILGRGLQHPLGINDLAYIDNPD